MIFYSMYTMHNIGLTELCTKILLFTIKKLSIFHLVHLQNQFYIQIYWWISFTEFEYPTKKFPDWVEFVIYIDALFVMCSAAKPRAAGSTCSVPVCTVPSFMDRTSRCNKVDTVRMYASYRLNLLLLNGQRCVKRSIQIYCIKINELTLV